MPPRHSNGAYPLQYTRFKGDQVANFSSLKDAADAYPKSLTDTEQLGFWQKPYDWSEGHVNFLDNMYQLLNAIQAMRLKPAATIIEVGSGAGWTTEVLAALGYKVICLEPAEVMLNAARQRVADFLKLRRMPHLISNVSYHCMTLEEADFLEDECADAMLFFESFHHIIDEHKSVRDAWRILKSDGCLCILGDSNWHPGNEEQERFWLEEMERFGTLESPFTHQYLEYVLGSNGFTQVTRHHAVNAFIPVGDDNRPVRSFVKRLDAYYLNLYTARKAPAANENLTVARPIPIKEEASPLPQTPVYDAPLATTLEAGPLRRLARSLYHRLPILQPFMRWAAYVTGLRKSRQ